VRCGRRNGAGGELGGGTVKAAHPSHCCCYTMLKLSVENCTEGTWKCGLQAPSCHVQCTTPTLPPTRLPTCGPCPEEGLALVRGLSHG
jgi:hypothetical protein